ncbi:hypothetical protein [Lysobacter niastensis]|uniref:Secreted protein n=1 Tax=Lysobacter niastensis TaxID=380629 RepID=A0ABS0BD02_9GAMM|nr:hypothetical protein [Lysobacter niastensis]MBF6025656.1 hypothetical protein [Lysobacter niastensis]
MRLTRKRPLTAGLLATALALFLLAPCVAAQQRIEQQMTPEQIKATGLDRLTPEQLANLNAWLNGKLELETTKAAESAKKKVEQENRGFASFGSSEPVTGHISGDFRGFGRGRNYTLDNGQVWEQVDDATLAGTRLTSPQVKISPSLVGNSWYMSVEGFNTRAKVRRVK